MQAAGPAQIVQQAGGNLTIEKETTLAPTGVWANFVPTGGGGEGG